MKKLTLIFILLSSFFSASADHLKGGFFTYQYTGPGSGNTSLYRVKLTVYMTCQFSAGQITNPISFTFFNNDNNQVFQNVSVNISSEYNIQNNGNDPCILGDQNVCYHILEYTLASIELPNNTNGFTISYQRCCRIIDIKNMPAIPASNTIGNTYSIVIPGSSTLAAGEYNSSPVFEVNDLNLVCGGYPFQIPFSATDPDNIPNTPIRDSLSYSFCGAWTGGGPNAGNGISGSTPNPASTPPYSTIPYAGGFSGGFPLGSQVTINPQTGLISGVAPTIPGEYVVTVCVNEYRQGVLIASTRKELHLKVGDCDPIKATLNPQYITCDGFNLSFSNLTNNGVTSYLWDFGDPTTTADVSTSPNPSYTYPDTGVYIVKLTVNLNSSCPSTTTAIAKVYPGFFPGFTINGICINRPTQFFDTTRALYGFANSWRWDFGDVATNADTSRLQNPVYTYGQTGVKSIRFIVTSNKGCIDTVNKDIIIMDKPPLNVLPKDTLICNGATVVLGASGNGNFTWAGPNIVSNGNTPNPTVAPTTTSNYYVTLNDQGCINTDTMQVRVVNVVSLQAMPDTVICATDSVQLSVNSNGLRYTWTPATSLNNPALMNPTALPTTNPTTYTVTARIDHCIAVDDITVTLAPYPVANAGPDTVICYDSEAQLRGSMIGTAFTWSPVSTLMNSNTLNPIAFPLDTTAYVLSVTDILGCPKPKRDTAIVYVLPEILAFAGRDTAVVVGQPLQFNASGGTGYVWSPPAGLNNTSISNPIGVYNGNQDSIRYKVLVSNAAGCFDSAYVTVRVFRTNPQIFVPTAFTPNGDGKNDYVRPIPVGITRMDYFRIYNRWGQLVYSSTNTEARGWDGRINGQEQATATFVWIVRGSDFTGKVVFAKGTVTLIR